MSFYDGIKDVATVLKTAGNIELYQKLLDIGAQALDMQDEQIVFLNNDVLS